ncbi:M48 family metalloprotease [Dyadobacter sp. CY261]|uniref:M56 family metallopeptidase n=1 Tax=Dyadobacter sp. CY261 TaxID=2907203 RepID=UPI001F2C2B8F|nr:M56 family metallopeptidase [Dyadobacter sp. CY261]MCF0069056.1 M48 family metalloprotease [Dyadobacter sp. CY261]
MNWNIIDQPATHLWIEALCLTLMHSLWQGLIAAILVGGILLSTRKSKPALRYNLLALVMFLFVSVAVLTFVLIIGQSEGASRTMAVFSREWVATAVLQNTGNAMSVAVESDWMASIIHFFSRHAQVIVAVWFVIFALKSLQAASGLHYLNKVTRSVAEPQMKWIVRFYELAERMQIRGEIELRESAQVAVPMVIGFLKPVVLVPLGMLANLPAGQVEAILLHELAHIRRRDYLVNLLQIFCENVFFFNPAVLWVSKLIREQREHCCDDLAISVMQNKTSFIHALVSFQEYNQSRPAFEMAFSKKRNHLLDRIKRIVNNNNKPLDAMEKLFVTFSLAAAIALSAATAPEKAVKSRLMRVPGETQSIENILLPEGHEAVIPQSDTLPKKKLKSADMEIHSANVHSAREGVSTYSVTRNNKHYEIVQRNGKMISLWIDDQEIPQSEYGKYQPEIDKIMVEVKVQHERAEKEREKAEEMRIAADGQRREADKQREEAHAMRLEADKHREEANEIRVNTNSNRGEAEKLRVEANKHREAAEDMRKQADAMRLNAEKQRKEADNFRAEAEVHRKEAEVHRAHADKEREAYVKIQEGIINELSSAGLVKDKENLSYKLSNEDLIVNGEKQSADLHQKLKNKYLKDLGNKKFELMYNYRNQNGHIKTGVTSPREE